MAGTANACFDDHSAILEAGCNKFLLKPFLEDIVSKKMADYDQPLNLALADLVNYFQLDIIVALAQAFTNE